MNTRMSKDGWMMVDHSHMLFDEHNKTFKMEMISNIDGIKLTKQFIPSTYTTTRIVYFVDSTKHDSSRQFKTLEEARNHFNQLNS